MKIITNPQTVRELIGFRDLYLMLVGIPVLGFLVPVLFFGYTFDNGFVDYLPKWANSTIYSASYWVAVRSIFLFSRQRFPNAEQTWNRLGLIFVLFVPAYLFINLTLDSIQASLPGVDYFHNSATLLELNVASLSVILIVGTFYESAYYYARWRDSLVEQEKLRRQHTESQLEGLKNQVNPHFLFNSLNTLAYIIPEDPERAVRFVEELSRVYRYILEIRDSQLVPLSRELTFLDAYAYLLKERFGDKLHIRRDIPLAYENRQIIPLALQMLLENAIKHNEISAAYPLHINVYVSDDRLVVSNSLRLKKQKQASTKVGLQNIQNRYQFFTHSNVQISETHTHFQVTLPLLNNAIETSSSANPQAVIYPG